MGYEKAMKLAGANVLQFKEFGSYQGDWWAKVEYEGKTGWVHGNFGSCSYCDAFHSEFGYNTHKHEDDNYYDPIYRELKENCEECAKVKNRLIEFGKSYLSNLLSQEEAVTEAGRYAEWDLNAQEAIKFIKENAI
jgi:hypothetical protein